MLKRIVVLGLVVVGTALTAARAGSLAPGSGPELTSQQIGALEAAGRVVVLPDGQRKLLVGDLLFSADEIRNKAFEGARWPGGILYYQFSQRVAPNASWRNAFLAACAMWTDRVPNVSCVQRTNQSRYVLVDTHSGPAGFKCVSYAESTGMMNKPGQVVSIYHDPNYRPNPPSDQCGGTAWNSVGTIAHEIGHVFGFVHEQSRWDRDSYVAVQFQNLTSPVDGFQFLKVLGTKGTTYTPYDFNSIMHYGDDYFAKPRTKSIIPSACYVGTVGYIGTLNQVSTNDALELMHHYGSPIWEMLRRARDASCGVERVHPSELKHYCTDLGEACGETSLQHSAVTTHGTWWCGGGFNAACPGVAGPARSCCGVAGKVPVNVSSGRGSRSCGPIRTERRYTSNWSCGCPYFLINARCSTGLLGFDVAKIDELSNSADRSTRAVALLFGLLNGMRGANLLGDDVLPKLELLVVTDFDKRHYGDSVDATRTRLEELRSSGQLTRTKPLTRERLERVFLAELDKRK
jgi:Astacin (Peptidase family M12A)